MSGKAENAPKSIASRLLMVHGLRLIALILRFHEDGFSEEEEWVVPHSCIYNEK
ncbi:hypothetical protein [Pantoea vagans]|uniref:hypothetical protein n=1 Tax=Pantoea vagans TaxID=470934 RepID=UPI0030160642